MDGGLFCRRLAQCPPSWEDRWSSCASLVLSLHQPQLWTPKLGGRCYPVNCQNCFQLSWQSEGRSSLRFFGLRPPPLLPISDSFLYLDLVSNLKETLKWAPTTQPPIRFHNQNQNQMFLKYQKYQVTVFKFKCVLNSFPLVIKVWTWVKPRSNFEWNFPRLCISCSVMGPKRLLVLCAFLGEIVPRHLTAHPSLSVRWHAD